jgi:hypothetical protein
LWQNRAPGVSPVPQAEQKRGAAGDEGKEG